MRRYGLLCFAAAAACGSGSSKPPATSGPIESMIHFDGAGVRLYASHHKLDLSEQPIARYVGGLPAQGTIEVGANVGIPLAGAGIDLRQAKGKIAVRCLGHCQLGDDQTRLMPTGGGAAATAWMADGVAFSHLDLDGFEAHVEVAGGHARLTEWKLASADLELDVDLDITLGKGPAQSTIDACIRFRPTEALKARDARLYDLLTLASPVQGPDGRLHITVTGSVAEPRILPRVCGDGG